MFHHDRPQRPAPSMLHTCGNGKNGTRSEPRWDDAGVGPMSGEKPGLQPRLELRRGGGQGVRRKTGVLDGVSVGFDARRWLYVANSCFKLEKESRKKLGITPKTRGLKPLAGDAPPIFGHCHRSGTESRSVTALRN